MPKNGGNFLDYIATGPRRAVRHPCVEPIGRDMGQQVGGPARILDLVAAVGQLDDPPVITVATKTFYAVGAP